MCITEMLSSFNSLWAAATPMHLSNESVHRQEQRTCGINTLQLKIATLLTLETFKWEYSFATTVFTTLGYPGRHASVLRLGRRTFRDMISSVHAISGHIQFGTCNHMSNLEHSHFGTFPVWTVLIQDCITVLFQVTVYRQFARKVGPSANSALIRYSSLRL